MSLHVCVEMNNNNALNLQGRNFIERTFPDVLIEIKAQNILKRQQVYVALSFLSSFVIHIEAKFHPI